MKQFYEKKIKPHLQPDSNFMKYMRRDGRWISFLNALLILGISLFLLSVLTYAIASLSAYAFCITLLVFSLFCIFPAIAGLVYLRREKLIKEGKIIPKEKVSKPTPVRRDAPPPVTDGEYAPAFVAPTPRKQDPFFADLEPQPEKKSIVDEIKAKEREEKRIAELEQREQKALEEEARKKAIQEETDRIRREAQESRDKVLKEAQAERDRVRAEKKQAQEIRKRDAQVLRDRIRNNKLRALQEKKARADERKDQIKIQKLQKKSEEEPKIDKKSLVWQERVEQEAIEAGLRAKEQAEEEALLTGLRLYRDLAPHQQNNRGENQS